MAMVTGVLKVAPDGPNSRAATRVSDVGAGGGADAGGLQVIACSGAPFAAGKLAADLVTGVTPVVVGVHAVCVEPGLVVVGVVDVLVVVVGVVDVMVGVVVVGVVVVDVVVVVFSPPVPDKVTKVLSAETVVKPSTVDFARK